MKNIIFILFFIPLLSFGMSKQHSAYLYDFIYDVDGKKIGHQPGLYANELLEYNAYAGESHSINRLYSYGGDMEMYCHGSGGSDKKTPCTVDKMHVFYGNGAKSTKTYFDLFSQAGVQVEMMPVIDGVVNATGANDYLSALNTLDQASASRYADKVAALFCQNDNVAGVQFDLEPFDADQPGQAYFFEQIAKDFAGEQKEGVSDPYHCVNSRYPTGRMFSVFTVARKVNAKTAAILNQYHNGYIVDPLYDLSSPAKGQAISPDEYGRYAAREINAMVQKANDYHVAFQFAIPVAATHHEFESRDGSASGYQQIDYVRAAIVAMDAVNARSSRNYKGIALWTFIERLDLRNPGYTPTKPSATMKSYLATAI
jgi:hypothetical protein